MMKLIIKLLLVILIQPAWSAEKVADCENPNSPECQAKTQDAETKTETKEDDSDEDDDEPDCD